PHAPQNFAPSESFAPQFVQKAPAAAAGAAAPPPLELGEDMAAFIIWGIEAPKADPGPEAHARRGAPVTRRIRGGVPQGARGLELEIRVGIPDRGHPGALVDDL